MGDERWPSSRVVRAGRSWIALVSRLVPEARRSDWREEWEAELWQLWRRAGRARRPRGGRSAAVVRYLVGAPSSALWEIREEVMTDLWQDVRYAVRTLSASPGFLAVAVLTLALGIGANTTVFSLVNGLLFREPAAVVSPDRLVRIGRGHPPTFDNWSYPVYRDFRERAEWFSGVAGFANAGSLVVGHGTDAEAVPAQLVSHGYFDVLGVRPHLGREFVPEETATPGAGPMVVISHSFWQRRFGGRDGVVGTMLPVNGRDLEVIGVAPREFGGVDVFTRAPDLWIPSSMIALAFGPGAESMLERRGSSWFDLFARLGPDVSYAAADAATRALYARFDEEHPELAGQGVWLSRGVAMTPEDRTAAARVGRMLLGIVLLVLLIACANLAGLALARGAARTGEMGIRSALGASRTRVVRQLLTESFLVALAGGGVALAVTHMVAGRLSLIIPYDVSAEFRPDLRVVLFALGAVLFAAAFFGLLPALRASRADVRTVLAGSSRRVVGPGSRLRRGLVTIQLALSFVLLAGTGALLRSLHNARTIDPGFAADSAVVMTLDAGMRSGYDEDAGRAFFRRLREEIAALPGVVAVGVVAEVPIVDFQSNHTTTEKGEERDPDAPPPVPVLYNTADAGYFEAAGIPLLAGRTFGPPDLGSEAPPVAVINHALARRYFDGQDPVGRLLPFEAEPDWNATTRVIGVVADHHNLSLRGEPRPQYWIPFDRHYRGAMTLVARTAGDAAPFARQLTEVVERVDPGMPVLRSASLRELVGGTLRDTRLVSTLVTVLALIALLLAAVGLYGVMAFTVAWRTRELGVRIALGATGRDIVGMVVGQGLRLALVGLVAGIALALAGLHVIRGILFGVSPSDPLALAGAAAILIATTAAATFVPARRATRVEPVQAMEQE